MGFSEHEMHNLSADLVLISKLTAFAVGGLLVAALELRVGVTDIWTIVGTITVVGILVPALWLALTGGGQR